MSTKQMLTVLRNAEIPAADWKVTGAPGDKSYKVTAHSRENIPADCKSGKILFTLQEVGGAATVALVGTIPPSGADTVTQDGVALPDADVDGGVKVTPRVTGFPPRIRLSSKVHVEFKFEGGEDGDGEYSFEAKIASVGL
jgi:hypothetical protein